MKPTNWKQEINVLLIEDNLDLLEMEELQVRTYGFTNVFLAKNSDEAEQILKTTKIDLCLSDIKYPTKDGIEVMRLAKSLNLTPRVLIFISGYSDYKMEELYDVGASKYFEKPVSFKSIFQYIEHAFDEVYSKAS